MPITRAGVGDRRDDHLEAAILQSVHAVPIPPVLQYAVQGIRFAMDQKTQTVAWRQFIECGQNPFHGLWRFQPAGIDQSQRFNAGVPFAAAVLHAGRASIRRTMSLAVSARTRSAIG